MPQLYHIIVLLLAGVFVVACAPASTATRLPTTVPSAPTVPATSAPTVPATSAPASAVSLASTSAPVTPPPPASSETPVRGVDQVAGTVVRFSARSTSVEVTINEDNPAVRDFLSMLPLTLTLEEFNGREKIVYPPRKLAHAGSPGSDPEDGDLIYYVRWGNLGFYYNTSGVGYSDQTIHLGTYQASRDQLEQLEGQGVIVEVVR